jgi:hypothetical protein
MSEKSNGKPARVYVSGPMTGCADLNYPAFEAAAAQLRNLGYTVISPHELNPQTGSTYEDCMRLDIAALVFCDAIALLPGHENSRGARLEKAIGEALGMKIGLYSEFTFEP